MVKITIGIDGMMCGMCEAHVNDTVRNTLKVKKVTSSHKAKETVIIADDDISDDDIKALVEKTGYTLTGISREPYKKKGLFGR
ncbi:MAG: cation transporter [Lachnospiraceae bacterium]|nr:ATPase P [Lachnospira sp.]MBQ8731056.1 cation transporter [Lachnospiraceae bacterium]MBR6697502.1 cation transporter [Lachnospiraceae bacterium]